MNFIELFVVGKGLIGGLLNRFGDVLVKFCCRVRGYMRVDNVYCRWSYLLMYVTLTARQG